jgi:hypothetical protein
LIKFTGCAYPGKTKNQFACAAWKCAGTERMMDFVCPTVVVSFYGGCPLSIM